MRLYSLSQVPVNRLRSEQYRLIYMTDERVGVSAYGVFPANYDHSESLTVVTQMFDTSLDTLYTQGDLISYEQLPILRHIGKYKFTGVIKDARGKVHIRDLLNQSPDNFIGIDV